MKRMFYAIYDLDSTICDDKWRLPLISNNLPHHLRYQDYHDNLWQDKPHRKIVAQLQKDLRNPNCIVEIWTARPAYTAKETRRWLAQHVLKGRNLNNVELTVKMRPNKNRLPSPDLKAAWLSELYCDIAIDKSKHITNIVFYDDREDVLQAYYRLLKPASVDCGVTGCLVQNGTVVKNVKPVFDFATNKDQTAFITLTTDQAKTVDDAINNGFKAISMGYRIPEHMLKGAGKPDMPYCRCSYKPDSKKDAADLLESMASTFRERNAVYKDNYKVVGKVMSAFFPEGVTLTTEADHNFYHLFELLIVKLTRFTNSGLTHKDSIHDIAVYAAMLELLVNDHKIKTK